MTTKVRTHVLLSKKLLEQIDELVGERKRSEFINDVLEERVRRDRLRKAMEAVEATPPQPGAPPEWDEPGGPARWVHDLRHTKSARERRIEEMWREDEGQD